MSAVGDGPELTPEDVKEILRLVDESEFDEFELETPRFSIRFRRSATPAEPNAGENESGCSSPDSGEGREGAGEMPGAGDADGLVEVTAPMVGTFYRSPTPGAPPFVEVGSEVEEETQVCILEVMKLMNSVVAGVRGVVVEICRENASPVEYGDPLFRIRPA
ncbi:MAG: acetyl-CoA carboxylase biotin carboxyl carrier protein [Thermoleophilia bacterium]|nr:acetyl-CoA carboxylase biotin carboxyl carrier protein [Thermoleophilia bacterium]